MKSTVFGVFSLNSMRINGTDPGSRIGSLRILRERAGRDLRQPPLAQPLLDFGATNLPIISDNLTIGRSEYKKKCVFKHWPEKTIKKECVFEVYFSESPYFAIVIF